VKTRGWARRANRAQPVEASCSISWASYPGGRVADAIVGAKLRRDSGDELALEMSEDEARDFAGKLLSNADAIAARREGKA